MIVNLQATAYIAEKKGDVKRMRKDGKLPAVLYGHKEKTKRIYVEKNEFRRVLDILRSEAITINLKIEKKEYLCVIKAIQHNPVTNELLHIDFQHIHKKEKIKALIPIHIIGEAPGVKEGGILDQRLHEVVVKCLPADMPSRIDVDVSTLDLGQTIHLYDVDLPNVDFELTKETSIVSILVPRAVVVEGKPEIGEEVAEEEKKEEEAAEMKEEEAKDKEGKGKEVKEKAEQEKEDKQKPRKD